MNNKERYEIAFRLAAGASSGLNFLEDYLYNNQKTDIADIRSIYILLSYYVELLLKSRVVMLGSFLNKDDLKKKLIKLSHNLMSIRKELGDDELLKIGIKEITKDDTEYVIKTTSNAKIKVEDFIDIRYDYLFGKMRVISEEEHEEIMKYVKDLSEILKSVKKYNEEIINKGNKK